MRARAYAQREVPEVTTIQTRFGEVDASLLEELQHSFDARSILVAVQRIDQIRENIDLVRDGLMRLHSVADDLINNTGLATTLPGGAAIWELAEELSSTMADWPESIEEIVETLDELESLAPEPCQGKDTWPDDEE